MNLCRNLCRSGSTLNVMKIQAEESSAPVLPFIMCYLPLYFHNKVTGAGCMANFWRNTGSEIVLGLLPSFLLLTPPAIPQSPTGLQPLHTAFMGSGLSLPPPLPSLSLLCFVQLFHLQHQESVASRIFQHIKLL